MTMRDATPTEPDAPARNGFLSRFPRWRVGLRNQIMAHAAFNRATAVALGTLLAASVWMRIADLDRIPGINGDEAWYGVQVQAFLRGQAWQWRTPSGLPLNPFFIAPLLAYHALFPQPWLPALRLPSLLSGLLLIALTFPLVRRRAGTHAAWLATLFVAALPIHLAYSRFGWDASQSPLAGLIVLYFAIGGRFCLTLITWAAAMLVHPTNLFLAPILFGVMAGSWWEKKQSLRGIIRLRPWTAVLVTFTVGVGGLLCVRWLGAFLPDSRQVVSRLSRPEGWLKCGALYADLISGVTTYRYIVGPLDGSGVRITERLFWLGLIIVVLFGGRELYRGKQGRFLGLVAGCGASLVALYLLAGLRPLTPHFERYAMFFTVPSCLGAAWLLAALAGTPRAERWQRLGGLVLAGSLLFGFWSCYWRPLQTTGGSSHRSFRTGPVEPKLAAFRQILWASPPGKKIQIWAEDWWCFQPLRYLAADCPQVEVSAAFPCPQNFSRSGKADLVYVVDFDGGKRAGQPGPPNVTRAWVVKDGAGRPLLHIWQLLLQKAMPRFDWGEPAS
jgi:hypothetical protein